jgi:hypothetical protein
VLETASEPPYDGVTVQEVRVSLRRNGEGWKASAHEPPVSVTAEERDDCIRRLRDAVLARLPNGEPPILVVEAAPALVGVAEAAALLGWDKRRVVTYIDRGSFPEPLASLAGGRIWARDDVETFRDAFLARQALRRARRAARA